MRSRTQLCCHKLRLHHTVHLAKGLTPRLALFELETHRCDLLVRLSARKKLAFSTAQYAN